MKRIHTAGPSITEKEIEYVTDAVRNCWYDGANAYHERFEPAFAEYVGVPHALAVGSGTSALHLSMLALGIGPGDEVIVPELTWIATSAAASYVGARPVFADVDPVTWCLDLDSFRACITPRTRAVVPVDLYGGVPDLTGIRSVAEEHGIAVVEDAAQALGTRVGEAQAGSFGDTAAFSFHGTKTMVTGEGGMWVTTREDLYERALSLRDHGRRAGDDRFFINHEIGHKFKMSSMQAALGLAQLERIEELVEMKRRIFDWYREDLGDVEGITLNHEPAGTRNTYWMSSAVLSPEFGITKEDVIAKLDEQDIAMRPFFYPLSSQPAYADFPEAHEARERNTISYGLSPYGLNLPSSLRATRDDVSRVCRALLDMLGEGRG